MHSAIQRLINLQWVQCSWHISEKFKCLCSIVSLVAGPKLLKRKRVQFFSSLLNYEVWWLYLCIFLSRWGPACSSTKSHGLCWNLPCQTNLKQEPGVQAGCWLLQQAGWDLPLLGNRMGTQRGGKTCGFHSFLLCYPCLPCHFSHWVCSVMFRVVGDSRNTTLQCDYVQALWIPLSWTAYRCRITHICRIWEDFITNILP